jgi:hypothetical protein
MSEDESDFDFRMWTSVLGLAEVNVKKLETNLVSDLQVLLELREIDIESLKISGVGDGIRLRAGVAKLRALHGGPPPLIDGAGNIVKKSLPVDKQKAVGPDGERVYSLAEVEKLLAGKAAIAAGGADSSVGEKSTALSTLAALLTKPSPGAGAGTSDLKEIMRELLGIDDQPLNAKGEKCLLPINFLSCVRGTQNSEDVIHSGKGMSLVVQSTLKKCTTPDKLTVGQWTAANSRILSKLIVSGRLCGSEVLDYLEYIRKLGDLLQLYTHASVFQLDHNHRLELHESTTKRLWQDIDCTLENAHLKRRDDGGHAANTLYKPNVSQGQFDRRNPSFRRRGVCWAYNTPEGCSYSRDRCRYEHTESTERSARSTGGQERAPRFQNNSDRAVSKP